VQFFSGCDDEREREREQKRGRRRRRCVHVKNVCGKTRTRVSVLVWKDNNLNEMELMHAFNHKYTGMWIKIIRPAGRMYFLEVHTSIHAFDKCTRENQLMHPRIYSFTHHSLLLFLYCCCFVLALSVLVNVMLRPKKTIRREI
jgi:hypothetical protein